MIGKSLMFLVGQRPKYTRTKAIAFAQQESLFNINLNKLDSVNLPDQKLTNVINSILDDSVELLSDWKKTSIKLN